MFVHKTMLGGCIIVCSWAAIAAESPPPATTPAAASPNAPLKIEIAALPPAPGAAPVFRVTIENTSDKDVVFNLGMMLGNGYSLWPSAVNLVLTTATGKSTRLQWKGGFISGRVDDYLVPLRAGSAYTLRLKLDDYRPTDIRESQPVLEPGEHSVRAILDTKKVQFVNGDMSGAALIHLWTGQLESAATTFSVAQPR